MAVAQNVRRISLERKISKAKEAFDFLKEKKAKEKIISVINRNTSKINKDYFQAESLLNIFEKPDEDPMVKAKKLLKLKEKYLAVSLLEEYDLLHYINLIEDNYGGFAKEDIFNYFKEFPEIKYMKCSYRKVSEKFSGDCKKSAQLYSTALNTIDVDEKLEKLEKALTFAPWGSVEAIRIIQAIILIESGWVLGKNSYSFKKEQENNKKQRKVV